jgi:hypothetical protein
MFRDVCSAIAARRLIRVLLMAAMAGVAFQEQASADTISFTASVAPAASPIDRTYVFAGFDPAFGTLTRVSLFANEFITTTGSITNLSDYAGDWDVILYGSIRATFTNSAGSSGLVTPPVPPIKRYTIASIAPGSTELVNVSTNDANANGFDPTVLISETETVAEFIQADLITATLHADGYAEIVVPETATYSSSLSTLIS